KSYDDKFASWLLELDHIMLERSVLSDNSEDSKFIDRKFPNPAIVEYLEGISVSSVEKMAKAPSTKVVVISIDNERKLQLIKQGFAELQNWKPNVKTDFTYSLLLKDKTYLIVINSVRKPAQEQIEALKLN
ncbi:MAG TPA: hypothetical protein VGP65_10865, partial [Candidatus Angelobacter sp.]|nr:hypothetical protein [Candidatus Angelobacter sp.]